MEIPICQPGSYWGMGFLIAYSLLELYLGKTKKTKANSTLELVGMMATKLLKREKNDEQQSGSEGT